MFYLRDMCFDFMICFVWYLRCRLVGYCLLWCGWVFVLRCCWFGFACLLFVFVLFVYICFVLLGCCIYSFGCCCCCLVLLFVVYLLVVVVYLICLFCLFKGVFALFFGCFVWVNNVVLSYAGVNVLVTLVYVLHAFCLLCYLCLPVVFVYLRCFDCFYVGDCLFGVYCAYALLIVFVRFIWWFILVFLVCF